MDETNPKVGGCSILVGDCRSILPTLPADHFAACVTSPPYWGLRDYGCEGQIGLEASVADYVAEMVGVFREVRRVLRPDGTLWLVLGDAYCSSPRGNRSPGGGNLTNSNIGSSVEVARWEGAKSIDKTRDATLKPKDLIGLPWRVAFALQADGWFLRSDNVWHKPNPMPESVRDRPTRSHEYVFMLSRSPRYFYDAAAVAEPSVTGDPRPPHGRGQASVGGRPAAGSRDGDAIGDRAPRLAANGTRNARSVWTIATAPFPQAHFATFPPALAERCVKAGSPVGGEVLDPFGGAGTTGLVCERLGRRSTLLELNPAYATMAADRLRADAARRNVDA